MKTFDALITLLLSGALVALAWYLNRLGDKLREAIKDLHRAVPSGHATSLQRLFDYAEKLEDNPCSPSYSRGYMNDALAGDVGISREDYCAMGIAQIIFEWHEMKQQKHNKLTVESP